MAVGNSGMISSTIDFFLIGVECFFPLVEDGGGVIIFNDEAIDVGSSHADDETPRRGY